MFVFLTLLMKTSRNDFTQTILRAIEGKYFLWCCLALFTGLRIAWLSIFDPTPVSDATWYLARAEDIALGAGYQSHNHPTAFYPVGYPAILSVLSFLSDNLIMAARVANILLQLLSVLVIYRLTKNIFKSNAIAHIVVLILALYPNYLAYVNLIYNENLFLLLFSLLLVLIWKTASSHKIRTVWLVLTGLILAAATYVKPQAIFLPLIMLTLLSVTWKYPFRHLLTRLSLIYGMALICILPWQIRNYRAFGHLTFITTVSGYDLLIGNNPTATGNYHFDESYWKELNLSGNEAAFDKQAKTIAISYLRQNPGKSLARIPKKIFYFFWPGMDGISWNMNGLPSRQNNFLHSLRYLANGGFILLLLLFIVSLTRLVYRKKHRVFLWLTALMFTYFLGLSIVFFGESRFHFHLVPLMAMGISWFVVEDLLLTQHAKHKFKQ